MRPPAPPTDPPWLTGPRVAAAVAALGGGAFAAWLFRYLGEDALGGRAALTEPLTTVLFLGTSALTPCAVTACVAREPRTWAKQCALYGGLNGLVCMWAFAALAMPESFGEIIGGLLCSSFLAPIVGACFGLAFCAAYAPVLMLARRARRQPSLDVVSRMVPWCAAWLTVIGAVVGLGLIPQLGLGLACLFVSAALLAYGLVADRARGAFLERLAAGLAPQRLTRDGSGDAALPFVAGVGPARLHLVEEMAEGPFRSVATSEGQATFSKDPARERRAVRRRRALSAGLLAVDLGAIATVLALS
jgi:hypothetical protein